MSVTKPDLEAVVESQVEYFAAALSLPASSNTLKLAENNFAKLRADRAATKHRLAAFMAAKREGSGTVAVEDVEAVSVELQGIETQLLAAAKERDRRRTEFSDKVRLAMGDTVTAYRDELERRIDAVEDLVRLGVTLNAEAAVGNLQLHRVIGRTPALLDCLHMLRRILAGNE